MYILCQNISLGRHNTDEGCWTLERTILNKCIQLYLTYGFQSYINLRVFEAHIKLILFLKLFLFE